VELCGVPLKVCAEKQLSPDAPPESARVWPLTDTLARFLVDTFATPDGLRDKAVLELGAGTAALSCFVAAAYATVGRVYATDLPEVVPAMVATVEANELGGRVTVAPLRWGEALTQPVDVVLCCECLYWGGWSILHDDTRQPLLQTLDSSCQANGAVCVLAFTVRDADRELDFVRELLKRCNFKWRCVCGCVDRHVNQSAELRLMSCRSAPGSTRWTDAKEGDAVLMMLTRA